MSRNRGSPQIVVTVGEYVGVLRRQRNQLVSLFCVEVGVRPNRLISSCTVGLFGDSLDSFKLSEMEQRIAESSISVTVYFCIASSFPAYSVS